MRLSRIIAIVLILFIPFSISAFNKEVKERGKRYEKYLKKGNKVSAASEMMQIANIFWKHKRLNEAADKFDKALELYLDLGDRTNQILVYRNLSRLYLQLNKKKHSISNSTNALEISRKTNNFREITKDILTTSDVLIYFNKKNQAIEYLEEGALLAEKKGNMEHILMFYQKLIQLAESTGKTKKLSDYHAKYNGYYKRLSEEEKSRLTENINRLNHSNMIISNDLSLTQQALELKKSQLREVSLMMQHKQDSLNIIKLKAHEKELELQSLNKDRKLKELQIKELELESKYNETFKLGAIIILGLVMGLAGIFWYGKRQQSAAKKQIQKAHHAITESVNYATTIQSALLPESDRLQAYLKDHLVLYNPRDKVSGDFYWIYDTNKSVNEQNDYANTDTDKFMLAAVDCTGHGIPGAFTSMIGYNLLTNVVSKGTHSPEKVLAELNESLRNTLKQQTTNNKESMDMTLCHIDQKNKILEFSGAKNSLIYIQDGELHQIKGDRYHVGGVQQKEDIQFKKHEISFEKPTTFYMFSDGYQDQFDETGEKKFMVKRLKNLLLSVHSLPFEEQKSILNQELDKWKGNQKQTDDVLLMGFRLS